MPGNLTEDFKTNSRQRGRINITELEEKRVTEVPSLSTSLFRARAELAACKC